MIGLKNMVTLYCNNKKCQSIECKVQQYVCIYYIKLNWGNIICPFSDDHSCIRHLFCLSLKAHPCPRSFGSDEAITDPSSGSNFRPDLTPDPEPELDKKTIFFPCFLYLVFNTNLLPITRFVSH